MVVVRLYASSAVLGNQLTHEPFMPSRVQCLYSCLCFRTHGRTPLFHTDSDVLPCFVSENPVRGCFPKQRVERSEAQHIAIIRPKDKNDFPSSVDQFPFGNQTNACAFGCLVDRSLKAIRIVFAGHSPPIQKCFMEGKLVARSVVETDLPTCSD